MSSVVFAKKEEVPSILLSEFRLKNRRPPPRAMKATPVDCLASTIAKTPSCSATSITIENNGQGRVDHPEIYFALSEFLLKNGTGTLVMKTK